MKTKICNKCGKEVAKESLIELDIRLEDDEIKGLLCKECANEILNVYSEIIQPFTDIFKNPFFSSMNEFFNTKSNNPMVEYSIHDGKVYAIPAEIKEEK